MTPIDLGSYKSIYLQTAKENIDSLSASCTKLANNAQDLEAVTNLHINSHSLKSKSQVMGFTNIANLSAVTEKISAAILDGSYKISNELIVVLKESVEALSLCLSQIEKENKEKDLSEFVKKLEKYNIV